MSERQYYLSPSEFWASLAEAQDLSCITERVATNFQTLARNLLRHATFKRYARDVKDDLEQEMILKCLRSIHLFKRERYQNPHPFYTRACFSAAFDYLERRHYRPENLKRKLMRRYAVEHLQGNQRTRILESIPDDTTHQIDAKMYARKPGREK